MVEYCLVQCYKFMVVEGVVEWEVIMLTMSKLKTLSLNSLNSK